MKKAKQLLSLILCAVLLVGVLCACKNNNSDDNGSTTEAETVISSNEAVQNVLSQSVPEPDLTNAVKITLSDSNIKIEGNGAQEKDGGVTITDGGVYVIDRELNIISDKFEGTGVTMMNDSGSFRIKRDDGKYYICTVELK